MDITNYNSLPPAERLDVFRNLTMELKTKLEGMDEAVTGEALEELCPLKHSFGEWFYLRENSVPAGTFFITKIHKQENPLFLLKGKVTILSEEGAVDFIAPCYTITKPNTIRVVYVHEDCVAVNVHHTSSKDVSEIEDEIMAKNFDYLEENNIKQLDI